MSCLLVSLIPDAADPDEEVSRRLTDQRTSIMATLLKGLVAILTTAHIEDKDTGTDDHIYIGLVGRGGGREFALATEEEDFEVQPPGKPEVFLLGSFWDNPAASVPQAKNTLRSAPGGDNDPAR